MGFFYQTFTHQLLDNHPRIYFTQSFLCRFDPDLALQTYEIQQFPVARVKRGDNAVSRMGNKREKGEHSPLKAGGHHQGNGIEKGCEIVSADPAGQFYQGG